MQQDTLGHRERCNFVKTGRPDNCNCEYLTEKQIERNYQKRWDTSYWQNGNHIFNFWMNNDFAAKCRESVAKWKQEQEVNKPELVVNSFPRYQKKIRNKHHWFPLKGNAK